MYCNKCGTKINNNDSVCSNCGNILNNNQVSNNPNKNKRNFVIGIILLVFIVAGGVYFIGGKFGKMSEYNKKYDYYESCFNELILDNNTSTQYESLMGNLKSHIKSRNTSKCDSYIISLDNLRTQSESASVHSINNIKQEINSKSYITLLEAENSIVDDYRSKGENLVSQNKFKSALKVYNKWNSFLLSVSNSNSYDLSVKQIDVSEYPSVKIYLSMKNLLTEQPVDDLIAKNFYMVEKTGNSNNYTEIEIKKAIQLDKQENLNIDIVADISGSMYSSDLMDTAKSAMKSLVKQIQFNVGDKAGLLSFSNNVSRNTYFTNNASTLSNEIDNLGEGDLTAFYDALYASINQISTQEGAKCIMAFTDGEDNNSQTDISSVKYLAQRYEVPLYIIGIGSSLNNATLNDLATSTGGFYKNITNTSDMSQIYEQIFYEQKSMYLLEYETDKSSKESLERNIYIRYLDNNIMARNEYSYIPTYFMETTTAMAQYNVNGFIFNDSHKRYLTEADLKQLSAKEIRIARNEIYARHGRKFKDSSLQSYFNSCSWYKGRIEPDKFNEGSLNAYEKANTYFIREYENLYELNQ